MILKTVVLLNSIDCYNDPMYKITFYIPESHLEKVKNAMFTKGAGKIGNYDHYAWQTLGEGQYRPLENSSPHTGTQNKIETVKEYLVEMVCEDKYIDDVLAALVHSHPYETPAYAAWEIKLHG